MGKSSKKEKKKRTNSSDRTSWVSMLVMLAGIVYGVASLLLTRLDNAQQGDQSDGAVQDPDGAMMLGLMALLRSVMPGSDDPSHQMQLKKHDQFRIFNPVPTVDESVWNRRSSATLKRLVAQRINIAMENRDGGFERWRKEPGKHSLHLAQNVQDQYGSVKVVVVFCKRYVYGYFLGNENVVDGIDVLGSNAAYNIKLHDNIPINSVWLQSKRLLKIANELGRSVIINDLTYNDVTATGLCEPEVLSADQVSKFTSRR